jgi:hypothetical protein
MSRRWLPALLLLLAACGAPQSAHAPAKPEACSDKPARSRAAENSLSYSSKGVTWPRSAIWISRRTDGWQALPTTAQ